jgi:hypothetical protein
MIKVSDMTGSYTIPLGYHDGSGIVRALSNSGTYTTTSRGSALDMGVTNTYRYVDTSGVANNNTGTYTFESGDTGGTKDLGATNTYRYVNASNVYNKGRSSVNSFCVWTVGTNSANGSDVWGCIRVAETPTSNIIHDNSVNNNDMTYTFKTRVITNMTVNVFCKGANFSTYNWLSIPFFDVWVERIGSHKTVSAVPNQFVTLTTTLECAAGDYICIRQWVGAFQYGTTETYAMLYG